MDYWIRRMERRKHYYRLSLPKDLVGEAGLADAEIVILSYGGPGIIRVEEYRGKKEDLGGVQGSAAEHNRSS